VGEGSFIAAETTSAASQDRSERREMISRVGYIALALAPVVCGACSRGGATKQDTAATQDTAAPATQVAPPPSPRDTVVFMKPPASGPAVVNPAIPSRTRIKPKVDTIIGRDSVITLPRRTLPLAKPKAP
jgi:hypothetical protein